MTATKNHALAALVALACALLMQNLELRGRLHDTQAKAATLESQVNRWRTDARMSDHLFNACLASPRPCGQTDIH
jgi:hypothetical protein